LKNGNLIKHDPHLTQQIHRFIDVLCNWISLNGIVISLLPGSFQRMLKGLSGQSHIPIFGFHQVVNNVPEGAIETVATVADAFLVPVSLTLLVHSVPLPEPEPGLSRRHSYKIPMFSTNDFEVECPQTGSVLPWYQKIA
jgi:hypothetical protein